MDCESITYVDQREARSLRLRREIIVMESRSPKDLTFARPVNSDGVARPFRESDMMKYV